MLTDGWFKVIESKFILKTERNTRGIMKTFQNCFRYVEAVCMLTHRRDTDVFVKPLCVLLNSNNYCGDLIVNLDPRSICYEWFQRYKESWQTVGDDNRSG